MAADQHLDVNVLESRDLYAHLMDEAMKSLYVGRHRTPYDGQARMEDIIRKNATPVPGRHVAEVPA